MNGYTSDQMPDQHGKCMIVTGANTGIGLAIARQLAAKGARVLLACRDAARAEQAMTLIRQKQPGADLGFLPLDLADLASLPRTVEIAGRESQIDVLINNAGVMAPPLMRTAQGFELQFGVNHLGTFALTALLLPKLAQTEGARVVITASIAHKRGRINWPDLDASTGYNRSRCYAQSKLANLLFLLELERRLRAANSPVVALGCHPGVALTDLARHLPGVMQAGWSVAGKLCNTVDHAAWPALMAATSTNVEPGGYYGPQDFREMRGPVGVAKRSKQAVDLQAAWRLWEISEEMTGIDAGLLPV